MGVLSDLQAIYIDWRAALQDFLKRPSVPSRALLIRSHALLLLHIPLFSFLSPLPWVLGSRFSVTVRLVLPLLIPLFFVAFAAIYDRILLHEKGPSVDTGSQKPENAILFTALPACSAALFFLLHPLIGILMTLVLGGYSTLLAIRTAMLVHHITLERAAIRAAGAFLFFMIPTIALLMALNVLHSLRIVGRLLQ